MDGANIQHLLAMILYMLAVIAIGIVFARRANKDAESYFLGGRSLGPWVTAFSAEASDMSGYLLMGLPGLAYWTGLADAGWTCIGLALGTYLNFLITSRRLRRYSIAVDAFTVPDFFSKRYHEGRHKTLMMLSSLIIIIFFSVYAAQCLSTCGKLFANLFGLSYQSMMIVAAAFVLIYTFLGGFLAESASDFMQAVVMVTVLVLILIMSVGAAGGLSAAIQHAEGIDGFFSLVQSAAPSATEVDVFGAAKPYGVLSIVSCLAWGLGYFGMPHILLRFMAIEDDAKLKTSRRIATIWVVISMFIAVLIGIVGLAVTKAGKVPFLGTSSESETIIIQLSNLLSQHGIFFALIAGLVLAGILASTMSTADSQLLAAASSVSHDLVQDFFGKKLNPKASMLAARGTVIGIAIVGIFLAWNPDSSVFQIVSFAWAGFGSAFGPVVLFALFWKRTNKQGAIAGMVAGGAMVFIWKYLVAPMGGAWAIYELLPAFLVACLVIVVVSLLTPPPSQEIVEEFEAVGK